jgi:hypothetical protein
MTTEIIKSVLLLIQIGAFIYLARSVHTLYKSETLRRCPQHRSGKPTASDAYKERRGSRYNYQTERMRKMLCEK